MTALFGLRNWARTLLLVVVAIASGVAGHAQTLKWTNQEKALEASYQVALLIDWRQTSSYHHPFRDGGTSYGYRKEINPFLGETPSQGAINRWFLVGSIEHLLITNYLGTHKARLVWQGATLAAQIVVVGHNVAIGVKIGW